MLTVEYYTAPWCGPCRAFGPVMDEVMKVKGINYQKIDVDNNRELAMTNGISSVPTILFKVGEEIVYRQTGVMSPVQLTSVVNRFNG
jgi:thiol-disulfide isomerase/thioredoxin